MEIKNLKTGNSIRFGGDHFKRLVKLQETTGVRYFTKKDLAGCVSADKKTKTKPQQKVKKLGTNSKRKQKGGVIINDDTVRKFPDRIDENGVTHIGKSSKTELCMVCHEEWEVEDADGKKTKNLNLIAFQIDECGHEICTTCATRWFVSKGNITCPLCIVEVDVANLKKQIGIIENEIEIPEVFEAIRKNNLDKIKTYVEQGGDIEIVDTYEDEDGMSGSYTTPLTYACMRNQPEIIKYLVDIGADVDEEHTEYTGNTPLHYAVEHNSFEIVTYLVDNGADVNPEEHDGRTPLDFASEKNSLEIVTYLVDNGADVSKWSLYYAVNNNSLQLISYLVDNGGNINAKYKYGDTLLQHACHKNNLEIVTYLVDNGADVNSKNNYGDTPLTDACAYGSLEIVKYLVEKGADVNNQDDEGVTLLHNACFSNKHALEIVKYLVEKKKADVNSQDKLGNTPLHDALHNSIQQNPLQLVKYLVDKGAVGNAKNKDNKTPLDLARQKGHNEIVDFFTNIKRGGGKFRKNKNKP